VKKISEVVQDEQAEAINMWTGINHASIENFKLPRLPFELSTSPVSIHHAPPKLGENSKEILEKLGYTEDEIEQFLNDGTIQIEKEAKPI
jgi:formyl-CoA transferase/CoA:oxalate CoA-transferase